MDGIFKTDKDGNIVYSEESSEYDDENNMIHFKEGDKEEWYEYDVNNKCIHVSTSKGEEEWYEYDKNGNLIQYKDETGKVERWEYKDGICCKVFESDLIKK